MQALNGADAMVADRVGHLGCAFLQMDLDVSVDFFGEHGYAFKAGVTDGVGCVRSKAYADQFAVAVVVKKIEAFGKIFLRVAGPIGGKFNNRKVDLCANAMRFGNFGAGLRKKIHI